MCVLLKQANLIVSGYDFMLIIFAKTASSIAFNSV